jgi:hypothetical protein
MRDTWVVLLLWKKPPLVNTPLLKCSGLFSPALQHKPTGDHPGMRSAYRGPTGQIRKPALSKTITVVAGLRHNRMVVTVFGFTVGTGIRATNRRTRGRTSLSFLR